MTTAAERAQLELEREAALVVHNLRRRKLQRIDVMHIINNKPAAVREQFRAAINKYITTPLIVTREST